MTDTAGRGNQRAAIKMTPAEVDAFLDECRTMTMCSINHDGSIVMGETTSCLPIGTVEDSPQTLTERLLQASCNRCGLASNLSADRRRG